MEDFTREELQKIEKRATGMANLEKITKLNAELGFAQLHGKQLDSVRPLIDLHQKAITLRRCIKCGKLQTLLPERIFGTNHWKDTEIEDSREYEIGLFCLMGFHKWSLDK